MQSAPLFRWMEDRHRVYVNRFELHLPPPWTTDLILQQYRFTNVFRQLDKVTVALNNCNWPEDDSLYLFNLVWRRWFNWPETWALAGTIEDWPVQRSIIMRAWRSHRTSGGKLFTGAYMVSNGGSTRPKMEHYAGLMNGAWKWCLDHGEEVCSAISLEIAWKLLRALPGMGPFTTYEVVSDLRWRPLRKATDVMTWAHAGPGARRGLNRLANRQLQQGVPTAQLLLEMQGLLQAALKRKWPEWFPAERLELREIEHSLCEFDKYERVRLGEGRPRSRFGGV